MDAGKAGKGCEQRIAMLLNLIPSSVQSGLNAAWRVAGQSSVLLRNVTTANDYALARIALTNFQKLATEGMLTCSSGV